MPVKVPTPSFKTAIVDSRGFLLPVWVKFFEFLFKRAGGNEALSNIELEDQNSESIEQIEEDIGSLEAADIAFGSSITQLTNQIEDLKKAPVPE